MKDEEFNEEEEDLNSFDTRSFTSNTISQLKTLNSLNKTIKNSFLFSLKTLPSSTDLTNTLPSLNSLNSNLNSTNFYTHEILTKFWKSFKKYSLKSINKPNSDIQSTGLSLPIKLLYTALQSISTININNKVNNIIKLNNLSLNESISWVEYRDICYEIFRPETLLQSIPNQTLSNSLSEPSIGSKPYEKLLRCDRTANSISNSLSDISATEPFISEDRPPLMKETLCNVLKTEYRKIRKAQEDGNISIIIIIIYYYYHFQNNKFLGSTTTSINESIPHYQTDTQKTKISSIINQNESRPIKWKRATQRRNLEEKNIERLNHRKVLLQHLKTVIVAQDRYVLIYFYY